MKIQKIAMWVLILIGASVVGWLIFKFALGIMVAVIALVGGIIGYAIGNIAGRLKMKKKMQDHYEN